MNTRQALEASVERERGIAALAKRTVIADLRRQLAERLSLLRFELEAEDWARAADQGDYVAQLLRSLAANEEEHRA